jgi:hypothetical protein
MPIQNNRYYNDPNIGQAFSNLASMFGPPSGSDLAGYATAKAKKEEASRLAQIFSYANDPTYNREMADRLLTLGGVVAPSQSYYSVDQGNATTRRGQDIGAQTLTANNAADNTRQLEQTRLQQTGETTRSMLAPVGQGATRFVPGSIADLYGVPETQTGVVNVGQGETATLPGGQVITGQAKPLSEEQVKGAILQGLPSTDQRNVVTAQVPVEQIIGANGKPVIATRQDAVGQEPFNPSADKSLVEGTANVGGKAVQVYRKPNESTYFTADGHPVPPDVQVFDKARPVGTSEQVGMKATEFTTKNGMFYNRAASAASNIDNAVAAGFTPGAKDFELMLGGAGEMLPLSLSNNMVSPEGRQFYNSAMNFMLSVLRPDTGAAFGKEEFANYAKVFIPLPGDDPETIANKKIARDTALAALQGSSAGSAEQITRIMQANGVPVPPEMLAHMQSAQQNPVKADVAPPAGAPAPAPAGAPAPAAATGGYAEGTIITNGQEKMIRQNGKWVPYGG